MLQPKKQKYRKVRKGRNRGTATSGHKLAFGTYGLKSLGRGRLNSRQIEAARRAMTRYIKRGGTVWIRVFPDKPITKKPAEVRMGGGKGAVDQYVFEVKPGKILYEMSGVAADVAKSAFRLAGSKLPFSVEFVTR